MSYRDTISRVRKVWQDREGLSRKASLRLERKIFD
jgi:hypothetical protein